MRNTVAVFGLTKINNWGENFLADTISYLVKSLSYNPVVVDIEHKSKSFNLVLYYFLLLLSKCLQKIGFLKNISYRLQYLAVCVEYRKYYTNVIKNSDYVIFAMGSFKYSTQKLWAYYSLVVSIAEKYNVPVMFNAVNIQKVDENDWRCKVLKETVNKDIVKTITTRDGEAGIDRICTSYLKTENKFIDFVGDPALWIRECYSVTASEPGNVVGINLVAGKNFKRYGGNISESQLIDFYVNLLKNLDEQKVEWEIFTNGLSIDYEFGLKIINKYDGGEKEIRLFNNQADYVEGVKKYKTVLAARLHCCICSYTLDIPFVTLAWDEKITSFANMCGFSDLICTESDLLDNKVTDKLLNIYVNGYSFDEKTRDVLKNKTRDSISSFLHDN